MSEVSDSEYVNNVKSGNERKLVMTGKRASGSKDGRVKVEAEGNECSELSPTVSRYGRARKIKISEDFLPTDKKVGTFLCLSPKKSSTPSPNITPQKLKGKDKVHIEGLKEKEVKRRGRPKLKLNNSPKSDEKGPVNHIVSTNGIGEVKHDLNPSDIINDAKETLETSQKLTPNAKVQEVVNATARISPDTTTPAENIPKDVVTSKSLIEESLFIGESVPDCGWKPGDLAWARIGGHPFWPCMIAVDLQTGLFTKTKRAGRGQIVQRSLHVQFYGDNGRHCWISSSCVIRFEGKEGLEKFAEKVLSEIKKKDKKYSSAFVIRPSAKSAWDCAVREAEDSLPQSRDERIRYFLETFPPEMRKDYKNENLNESTPADKVFRLSTKRKRSSSDSDEKKPLKQVKVEPDSTLEIKVKSEPAPLSSPNRKKIKKIQPKKKKKKKDGGFSVYVDKFSHRVSEDHPEMSAQEVKTLLAKLWSELDEREKSKYESRAIIGKDEEEESSAEEDDADEENDDDNNDNLSNSTREMSPNLFAPFLKKGGGGIFRGTRLEKVCQLCLKSGNTVKCKGPCLGVFHLECIKNPPQTKTKVTEGETKGRKKKISKSSKVGNSKLKIKTETGDEADGEKLSESDETCDGEKEQSDKDDEKQSQIEDESSESNDGEFRCKGCSENRPPPCFVCGLESDPKTNDISRVRCSVGHCGKFYHMECLTAWPQASCSGSLSRRQSVISSRGTGGKEWGTTQMLTCPQHVCHTCASDDPRNATMRFNHERLVRCVLCPTAYHTGNYCVPAGSEILTGCQIICPKHYVPPPKASYHVNASWCFICAVVGGSLICCDLCPTSFHAECLRITPPEEGYICEDCDTGRFPLYGEVVWVKLGAYRWWPAQILFPNQIPDNIENIPHVRGEFAVKFFGSHDYYWVNRGRVFLYQDGDTGHRSAKKTSVDGVFQTALVEALDAHKKMRVERSQKEAEARPGMKPPTYVRIKCNRPVGNVRVNDPDPASMTPCDCNPKAENPCGFGSDCINRILMVECNPSVCPAGDRCANQCFSKRQYPPLEPFRTESRGWGLRALKDLRKGEFVIEYVGEMIDEEEYKKRLECKHMEKDENYYFLTIDKDRMLDAGPKGNVARFMNHSCQPNCETQKWTVNGDTHVGLFALKDIPENEELTFNYNLECVGTDKKPCMCGAPNCSGFIGMKVSKVVEDDKKLKGKQEFLKRRKKRQTTKLTEAVCFKCGDGGDLLLCDNKTCPKGYHLGCAKRRTWPQGKWICPWHYCNLCKKRTASRCGFCPSSFCLQHAEGNIRVNSELGSVCQEHDVVSEDTVTSSVNENTLKTSDDLPVEKETGDSSKSKLFDSVSSSVKLPADKKENVKSESKKEDEKKTEVKVELMEPVPSTSGLQVNSGSPVKKKRGRPRKYPIGATPEMILKIKQESPSPVKNGMITPKLNPAAVANDSSVKRKRGRPRKYLPNPLAVNPQLPTGSSVTSKSPPTPRTLSSTTPKTRTPNNPKSVNFSVDENKKKIKVEPQDRLTETPKSSSMFNLVTPRTSNRKRHPSERFTEYYNSLPKAKKCKSLPLMVKEEPKSAPVSSLSPSFYSENKKLPKKTILQRIDHKPDVSKVLSFTSSKSPTCKPALKPSRFDVSIRTPLLSRASTGVNTVLHGRTEARSIINSNVTEMIYRKNDISGIVNDDIHTNGILESLNESDDSQYFGSAVTTIPLKCPEFVQTRNEFLIKENESEACVTGLESQVMQTSDNTEKLTEDGKYQILTNVCPETLASIDNTGSLLLHVGS